MKLYIVYTKNGHKAFRFAIIGWLYALWPTRHYMGAITGSNISGQ